jgi:hypothetical protein
MSLKDEKISFSDQISSRLHRWVQRTTSKVRNEKERSQSVIVTREENEDVIKGGKVDIKKCPPRENFARRSRESRSYEELEKALKDLINNCVTSSSVVEEGSLTTHDNTNINITRENNNNTQLAPTTNTNDDFGTEFNDQFAASKNVGEVESSSGSDSLQETQKKSLGTSTESHSRTNNVDAPPQCQSKQNDVDEKLTEGKGKESLGIENENDTSLFSSGKQEGTSEHEKRCNDDLNNVSKPDNCEINISLSNVNRGLNTPLSRSSLKTHSSQSLARKPPLRRIQSEGDALELKLCFKNNDVTEFAATCIRHAQKKRFSDTTPDRSVGNTCMLSKNNSDDVLAPNGKESAGMLEHAQTIPEITLDELDSKTRTKTEHIPLSDRPSSLSFPLETPIGENNASSFKNIICRRSPSSPPRSVTSPPRSVPSPSLSTPSSSRSTPSPKFRRFPCQPVFYVPSESRTVTNSTRSGSVGEQSKEYLI